MTCKHVPFFDRKDLRPYPSPEEDFLYRPTLRSREVCLSPNDWRAFGDALKQLCPDALYLRRANPQEERSSDIPDFQPVHHLCGYLDTEGEMPWEIDMGLDPDWKLRRWQITEFGRLHWRQNLMPLPKIKFRPGYGVRPADQQVPEHIKSGQIWVYCAYRDKDHLAFARRFYRLFGRFATNTNQRVKSYWEKNFGRQALLPKGSVMWLGHDAIRWVREDPARELYDVRNAIGYRPADDEKTG